jgi:FAD/FMN-containing dehydrogenase
MSQVFEPFYDPADLSACVEASTTVAQLNERCRGDGIYFPLWRDPQESLGKLYLRNRVASRSFRFGLVGDNVLGCRFRLKNGKTLDVGGRVVKNVVGLDLTRFFSGSLGLLGEPETLILRLRPLPTIRQELALDGSPEDLERFRASFLLSPWVHCVDAFDFEIQAGRSRLHLAYACSQAEAGVYERNLKSLAEASGCQLSQAALPQHAQLHEELVPLSKTLVAAQARGQDCSGFLGHGLILGPGPAAQAAGSQALNSRVQAMLEGLA